jgi:hypothetical protein
MAVKLNDNVNFSINQAYSKLSNEFQGQPIQVLSTVDSESDLIIENELEDNNEESITEEHSEAHKLLLVDISEASKRLLTDQNQNPQSLNILYCVFRI